MNIIKTIIAAFSMYSAIPMPSVRWEEKNTRYLFAVFPLVGVLCGVLEYALITACEGFHITRIIRAAVFVMIPIIITGGIHADGFADTTDALCSHADREKKLKIMDDPHIGAFAAVHICMLFLLGFALAYSLPAPETVVLIFGPALSRALCGISICILPQAKNEGMLSSAAKSINKKITGIILAAADIAIAVTFALHTIAAFAMWVAAHLVLVYYYFMTKKQFGGITGDTCGWFICECELWMLAAYCMTGSILNL